MKLFEDQPFSKCKRLIVKRLSQLCFAKNTVRNSKLFYLCAKQRSKYTSPLPLFLFWMLTKIYVHIFFLPSLFQTIIKNYLQIKTAQLQKKSTKARKFVLEEFFILGLRGYHPKAVLLNLGSPEPWSAVCIFQGFLQI